MFIRVWCQGFHETKFSEQFQLNKDEITSFADIKPLPVAKVPSHSHATVIVARTPNQELSLKDIIYYVPQAAEDVRQAISICEARNAREAAAYQLNIPGDKASADPIRSWDLDMCKPDQITMIENTATFETGDILRCDKTLIALKTPGASPSPV